MIAGYLFDTNILIEFFKKQEETTKLLTKLNSQKHTMAISVLTVMELRAGWTDEQAQTILPYLYAFYTVYPLNKTEAELAGKWRKAYKQKGILLPAIDSLIGATAVTRELFFVTRNTKHFPMPEIQLYDHLQTA